MRENFYALLATYDLELYEGGNGFRGLLEEVESCLESCAEVLNRSQPPMAGKIILREPHQHGRKPFLYPAMCYWNDEVHRLFSNLVPQKDWPKLGRMAKRTGRFAINRTETAKVISLAVTLLQKRERLLASYESHRKVVAGMTRENDYDQIRKDLAISLTNCWDNVVLDIESGAPRPKRRSEGLTGYEELPPNRLPYYKKTGRRPRAKRETEDE